MAHKQSENLVYKLVLSAELEIDAEGRIWRVAKRTFDRWTGGTKVTPCTRVRAEQKTPDGYLQVRAMIDGKRHYAAAARLVWLHFKGPIPQGLTANHKDRADDGDPPRPGGDHRRNCDPLQPPVGEQRPGGRRRPRPGHLDGAGSSRPRARVSEVDVLSMRRLRAQGWRVRDIAERFGTTPNAVSHACRGKTWKHVPTS